MDKVYDVILVWLNNHTRMMANAFLFLLSVFVLLSCSHGKYDFDFKSADHALKCYQSLCNETKGKKSITSKEAVPILQEWHESTPTKRGKNKKGIPKWIRPFSCKTNL